MDTFSNETKQSIFQSQNGMCATKGCLNPIHSFHHLLKNCKANRNKFPLLIHSVFACVGLCFDCHTNKSFLFRISEKLATVYENYLRKLIVNMPFSSCGANGTDNNGDLIQYGIE